MLNRTSSHMWGRWYLAYFLHIWYVHLYRAAASKNTTIVFSYILGIYTLLYTFMQLIYVHKDIYLSLKQSFSEIYWIQGVFYSSFYGGGQ